MDIREVLKARCPKVLKAIYPQLLKARNPIGSIGCELLTIFLLIPKSSWFKSLSPVEAQVYTIIAVVYIMVTIPAATYAYAKPWEHRISADLTMKFVIQGAISGIITFLTDVFGEHHNDGFLAGALVLGALHFHFGAHSFCVLEDFGLAQGLITVAITALMHLPKKRSWKIGVIVVSAFLLACYGWILNKEAKKEEKRQEELLLKKDNYASALKRLQKEALRKRDEAASLMKQNHEIALYEKDQRILNLEDLLSRSNSGAPEFDQGQSSQPEAGFYDEDAFKAKDEENLRMLDELHNEEAKSKER